MPSDGGDAERAPRFSLGALSEDDAREVLAWRYPAPYDFYNADQDPEDAALFLDPAFRQRHLIAARDGRGVLRGFFEFHALADAVEIGLGLRPQDTGQGLGAAFLATGLAWARERYAPDLPRLYVAEFNERAVKVYMAGGFRVVGRETRQLLGRSWPFLVMERPL